MKMLKEEAKFPGGEYGNPIVGTNGTYNTFLGCKYYMPKTIGFYQLRNTFTKVEEPFNTYMFVSDANAPVPLYDVDVSDKDDAWWNTKENALSVANSLFLFHNLSLFDDTLANLQIKGDVGKYIYKAVTLRDYSDGVTWRTWKDVWKCNLGWHCYNTESDELIASAGL